MINRYVDQLMQDGNIFRAPSWVSHITHTEHMSPPVPDMFIFRMLVAEIVNSFRSTIDGWNADPDSRIFGQRTKYSIVEGDEAQAGLLHHQILNEESLSFELYRAIADVLVTGASHHLLN